MNNILLIAKFLAKKDLSENITLEHIKKSLDGLVFKDLKAQKLILDYFNIKEIKNIQLVTEKELVDIKIFPKILFDKEVKKFNFYMRSNGYTEVHIFTRLFETDFFKNNAKKLIELGELKSKLSNIIFEQDIAIESVKDTISRALFEEKEDSVKAILFFVGPPATGKTFLAEQTGLILKDFGYVTKIFNMTMYSNENSNLTGLLNPYVGAGKGDLTKFIEKNPKSLIVFDEIEKCHIQKQQDLFRLLDRGYVEDKYNNSIVKANDCILIFTSNLGKDIYERNNYSQLIKDQKQTESLILQSITKEKHERDSSYLAITPALTSRLSASKIVLFNKVGLSAYTSMATKEINRYFDVIKNKFDINFEISEKVIISSFLKYLPFIDPRRIKSKIGDDLFDYIRDYIQSEKIDLDVIKKVKIDVDENMALWLDKNFMMNSKFNDLRFLELIDKKETIYFELDFKKNVDSITINFNSPKIEKIKNIQDFDGEIKVELDIPVGKIEGEPNTKIFGHEDAKKMLVRIAKKIQLFQKYSRENHPETKNILKNIPKGILLYGPSGTGKTKLARAFAAQVEVPIIVTSGKDMTTIQYTGTGIQKIKDIFKKARSFAPCILFIDEIDAIGSRGQESNSEQDKNINALLEELDGFNNDLFKPVFIISATNRKDIIDPAIIRPGRIEEHIEIPVLSKEARKEYIEYMFEKDSDFSKEINIVSFLQYTIGMSGAQLEQVFKKAKYNIEILREDKNDNSLVIDLNFLIDVVNEIRFGKINKKLLDAKDEILLTAYHEAGHAIVSLVLNPTIPIEQITIAPRSNYKGFVSYNHEEVLRWDKKLFKGKIASAYAGRLAEEIYFEKNQKQKEFGISTGASFDISNATNLIKDALLKYGMDEELGLINYSELNLSEKMKEKIDDTILRWEKELKLLAYNTLMSNWEFVEKIVNALVGNSNEEFKDTLDSSWIKENIKRKD